MDKSKLEYVQGLSRHLEMLWIERDDEGKIKHVYDIEYNQVPIQSLYKSFIMKVVDGGFTYRDEFIPMENVREEQKYRSLDLQRKKGGHRDDYMSYINGTQIIE